VKIPLFPYLDFFCQATAIAALIALAPTLSAQTYTWAGDGTNLWSESKAWVGAPRAPTFSTQTQIIFDNASVVGRSNAVSIGGNRIIRSLTINANYATTNNNTFDIRTFTTFGGPTGANLRFESASGIALIKVAQSTAGTAQVRLGSSEGGNVIIFSDLDLVQNNTFFNSTGFQFDGSLAGPGAIIKSGAGEVRLVRNNQNWSGWMNITEGNVSVFANSHAMGIGSWTLGGGANNTSFSIGSNATQQNPGGLVVEAGAGTRTIALMSTVNGNPTLAGMVILNKDVLLDVGAHRAVTHERLTLAGVITGIGGIVKTGEGTLHLSGNNTFSGRTTIKEGVLLLTSSNSLASRSELVLAPGTTLDLDFRGTLMVGRMSLDGGVNWLAHGNYTSAQLARLGYGRFRGAGMINVSPVRGGP
jgi:fibronectin-binding autotransporter adhesin